MKKILFLILLSSPIYGADNYQAIAPFGGINNSDSPIVIDPKNAQDLLNVDVTPGGKSIKKREGYSLFSNLSITTSAVHGIYNFFDSIGNSVDIYFNDTRMTSSVGGATPSVIFSTGSLAATYQCIDSQGYAYCANTGRTSLIKTNGQTCTTITTVNSTGTMVAVTPERLVTSGFAEAPNRIDLSKANDFSNWVIGSAATDAAQFTIVSPGSRITHIVYAFGRIIWFKDSSFGFLYIGQEDAQADWQIKTVDPQIGTLDNTSVYREGLLYFRAQDGHIYAYDGSSLTKLTRDLEGTIQISGSRTINSWIQDSQADFSTGFSSSTVFIDTDTVAGNVQLTFPDNFNAYRDGSSSSKIVWATDCTHGVTNDCGGGETVSASSGKLNLIMAGSFPTFKDINTKTVNRLYDFRKGTTFYVSLSTIPLDFAGGSYGNDYFAVTISSASNPTTAGGVTDPHHTPGSVGSADSFSFVFESSSTGAGQFHLDGVCNVDDGCQSTSSTLNFSCPAEIYMYISTTTYSVTINGTAVANGTHSWSPNRFDPYLWLGWHSGNTATTAKIEAFGVSSASGTFQSSVKNAPSLSSWDTLNVSKTDENHSFFMRSSNSSFNKDDASPQWYSVTNGAIPAISTGSYFQFRDVFSINYATAQPSLNSFTVNWFEGTASDKSYATYFNDSIFWSISSGVSVSSNTSILKLDLLNQDWYIYDIGTNGMLVRNNSLYFGSSSLGKIYKFGDVDSDDGNAINAYWKSKDYVVGDPFVDKDFKSISVSAGSVSNSTVTVTYQLNGSSTTSFNFPLYSGLDYYKQYNKNLPLGTIGKTFSIKFGNNGADQPFEIFAGQFGYVPKTWIPSR